MKNRPAGIIVVGPFRSGTSLTSRILSALGVDFGPRETMLKADRYNPDGYFQHDDVRVANNRLIKSVGSTIAWPEHPEVLSSSGNLTLLKRARLDWTHGRRHWGIKDPRFCATLLSWINADRFDPLELSMIRVERNVDDAANDLFGMPELSRQLSDRTLESARTTVIRYAELAAWHTQNLGIPSFTFSYDTLLGSPRKCVGDLADFIHIGSKRRIEAAAACVRGPQE